MPAMSLNHYTILARDLEATKNFYTDVVGLSVGERPPLAFPGYWLYAGTAACVHVAERRAYVTHAAGLGLEVPDDAPGAGPVDHIAFNATASEAIAARAQRHGVAAIRNAIPNGGPHQLFIEDPNGVRIEINVRHLLNEAREHG